MCPCFLLIKQVSFGYTVNLFEWFKKKKKHSVVILFTVITGGRQVWAVSVTFHDLFKLGPRSFHNSQIAINPAAKSHSNKTT